MAKKTAKKGSVRVRVTVFPRPEILDPQGKAIASALERVGFDKVSEVRAGKSFDLDLEGVTEADAREVAEKMADKLLANTVVEDYSVEILDAES
ncbi:MAG: phosphoribosylformylglycinamidine synthase subunit PurS [Thermoanaerobaculia bacterium]|nr:phosphoribosylformylglycinamidine synthase subunit PurS [Thermoanaerobaculia bacterium]